MTIFMPDDAVKNLKVALGNIGSSQVANVTRVYTTEPDKPPEDNSIVVGSPTFDVLSDTNAKLMVKFIFPVSYCVRRKGEGEDVDEVESYFMPMLMAYSSWANQELTDDAFITSVKKGGVIQVGYSGQIVRAIRLNIELTTEFNIPVS